MAWFYEGKPTIIAREIKKDDGILKLRDENGSAVGGVGGDGSDSYKKCLMKVKSTKLKNWFLELGQYPGPAKSLCRKEKIDYG